MGVQRRLTGARGAEGRGKGAAARGGRWQGAARGGIPTPPPRFPFTHLAAPRRGPGPAGAEGCSCRGRREEGGCVSSTKGAEGASRERHRTGCSPRSCSGRSPTDSATPRWRRKREEARRGRGRVAGPPLLRTTAQVSRRPAWRGGRPPRRRPPPPQPPRGGQPCRRAERDRPGRFPPPPSRGTGCSGDDDERRGMLLSVPAQSQSSHAVP